MKKQKAFTLVELLVVIAIISILAGLLLPALEDAIDSARRVKCSSQQKQVAIALTMRAEDYDGWFPMVFWMGGTRLKDNSMFTYFGAEPPTSDIQNDISAYGSLNVLWCPSQPPGASYGYSPEDPHLGARISPNLVQTTYRIVAARGNANGSGNEHLSYLPNSSTGKWYGWAGTIKGGNCHGSDAVPLPRINMLRSRAIPLSAAEQPMLQDMHHPKWPNTNLNWSNGYSNLSKYPTVSYVMSKTIHNHDDGANTAFVDGHVKWSESYSMTKDMRVHSTAKSALFW